MWMMGAQQNMAHRHGEQVTGWCHSGNQSNQDDSLAPPCAKMNQHPNETHFRSAPQEVSLA